MGRDTARLQDGKQASMAGVMKGSAGGEDSEVAGLLMRKLVRPLYSTLSIMETWRVLTGVVI